MPYYIIYKGSDLPEYSGFSACMWSGFGFIGTELVRFIATAMLRFFVDVSTAKKFIVHTLIFSIIS